MSQPVPRISARVWPVAGAYLRLLFHGGTIAVLCLGSADILANWALGDRSAVWASKPFNNVRELVLLMFFLPFVQWQGEGGRHAFALPLDRTKHEIIRVGCGTVWAAVCLAIPTAVETGRLAVVLADGPGFTGTYPAWYPVALFSAGISIYLFGSAMFLWSERPGRVFILFAVVSVVVPGLLPSRDGVREPLPSIAVWMDLLVAWNAEDFVRLSTPEQLAGVMLPLGFTCALVYVAAHLNRPRPRAWAGVVGRVEEALRRRLQRGPPLRSARRTAWAPGLRRPPSAVAIARRHFVLLRRRMTWPIFLALCFAWDAARIQTEAGGTTPQFPAFTGVYATVAICWSLLVWMDERDPAREFDEALPVGRVKKRILHAVAGATWLLLAFLILIAGRVAGAMAAGTLASPLDVPLWLWLGVPCGVLLLYLVGTIPTLLINRPAVTMLLLNVIAMMGDYVDRSSDPHPLSLLRAVGPFLNDSQGVNHAEWWSYTAAAYWLVVCAAAAVCALAMSDPGRGRRLPTAGVVVRSWRGRSLEPSPVAMPGAEARSGERGSDYIPHPL